MRQNQFSSWLTEFADQGCKTVQASYLDSLKSMIELKSDKKFATIQDALESFCTRLNLPLPDMKQVTASFVGGKEFNQIMAALGVFAFNTEEVDKLVSHGMPAEGIANQFGNTDEEKQAIIEYVESKAEKQLDESSQIARDMKMSDDLVKTNPGGGQVAVPKMSSIRSLSRVAQTKTEYVNFYDEEPKYPVNQAGPRCSKCLSALKPISREKEAAGIRYCPSCMTEEKTTNIG